ncbi:peptidylprolyl isomerase [Rickettsiales endosymbiont of Stachyamoeba lipophora]|uniref:peptidylprolyl isomerase n=1 Tax=Rickettsiales endosymbiont of Stachyamoeba lipophora TaxID=2486578 RepID=UPI000F64580B|nr:peptidylprolyl isomerase [Rickettsiales endosymbiont of Stachyamoeba lipophora]AZL15477.1 hypothetical protein EF513_02770 [Rickettsiales endosymbiont of Stachyamoeba lipophora]
MFATIKNIIIKIFLSIIILSFVIWGIGDIVKSWNQDYVAKIGKQIITTQEFKEQIKREHANLQTNFGTSFTEEQMKSLGFYDYVLNKMIQKILIKKTAEDLGLKLPQAKIAEIISQDPNFFTEGKFDSAKFKQFVHLNHLTERELSKIINDQIITKLLVDLLTSVEINIPDYPKYLAMFEKHSRTVDLHHIKGSEIIKNNLTDEQLKQFYDQNKFLFLSEELRDYKFATIDHKQITETIKISDVELKALYKNRGYDDRKKSFKDLQSQLQKQLTSQKLEEKLEELKNNIEDAIASGAHIEEIAKEHELLITSLDDHKRNHKDLINNKAFALSTDNPIELFYDDKNNKYVIIELTQIVEPTPKAFELVKSEIKELAEKRLMEATAQQIYHKTRELLTQNKEINQKELGIHGVEKNVTLQADGLNLKTSIPQDLVLNIFKVKKHEITNLTTSDGKNFYFAKLNKVNLNNRTPSKEELEALKQQLEVELKNEIFELYTNYAKKEYKVKINYQHLR